MQATKFPTHTKKLTKIIYIFGLKNWKEKGAAPNDDKRSLTSLSS
jgi:hypothetical protein